MLSDCAGSSTQATNQTLCFANGLEALLRSLRILVGFSRDDLDCKFWTGVPYRPDDRDVICERGTLLNLAMNNQQ